MDRRDPPGRDPEAHPDAPPSEGELAPAARLREALENPSLAHEDADLARAIALGAHPRNLGEDDHRALLQRALELPVPRTSQRGRVIRVTFGAASLAVAAAVLLWIGTRSGTDGHTAAALPALVQTRSTQPLFDKPFEPRGASARMDRIAMARASDLRENRFAMWGVR